MRLNSKPEEVLAGIPKWYEIHKRSRAPLFSELIIRSAGYKKEGAPFDNRIRNLNTFCDHVAIAEAEKERIEHLAVEFLKTDPTYLITLMQGAYREHELARKKWAANEKRSYASFTKEELQHAFQEYIDSIMPFGIYITLPLFAESYFERFIKQQLALRFKEEEADQWFHVAVDPVCDGTVLEEEIARLELARGDHVSNEAFVDHVQRFGWMANTGFFDTYYDANHYREQMPSREEASRKLEELRAVRKKHRETFNELVAKLADDSYLEAVVKSANEAVFFRSYRTEIFYSSPFYNQNLIKEVGMRLDLANYKDFSWFYSDEITTALLAGTMDASLIEKRKKGYVFVGDFDGVYYAWEGEEAQQAFEIYSKTQALVGPHSNLKGSAAFRGKVTAKAVVLAGVHEAHKVLGGEVLVTHATNINFVPLLGKVAAIITEEGGILSHAAIISREMRIPCVIGVKNATTTIHDGDLLEVDAEKGIISILL
jgi:phosphohistidine swiveling domain-containing protein